MNKFEELVFDGGCATCIFHRDGLAPATCWLTDEETDGMEQCHSVRLREMAWLCQQSPFVDPDVS